VNGRGITRVTRISPWAWLESCDKGISTWMYLGSANMPFMYIRESVCSAKYRCWLVSEMISSHNHLYMNLMGHTLKWFETLKSLSIWLSLVQVRDCWWRVQEVIITIQIKSRGIFDSSRIRLLIGLWLESSLVCSINTIGEVRGETHATTWQHQPPPPLGLTSKS
jgi:hypothetical protein